MTADDLLAALSGAPGSGPGLLAVAVALLWQISASAKRGFGAVQRLGRRIGALEKSRDVDRLLMWQMRQLLVDEDVAVPPWPAPDDLPDDDEDLADDGPDTRVAVPAIPPLPASLRRSPRP
jgi:hypothetical protein